MPEAIASLVLTLKFMKCMVTPSGLGATSDHACLALRNRKAT